MGTDFRLWCKQNIPIVLPLSPPTLNYKGTWCVNTVEICYDYSPSKPVLRNDSS